jgi:hypothetical protein
LPLHAQQFLDTLRRRAFDNIEFIPGNLHSLLAKPTELTRPRRTASLALVPAISLTLAILLAALLSFERVRADRIWKMLYPDRPSLRLAVRIHGTASDDDSAAGTELRRASEVYMAHHFADVLTNETLWKNADFADAQLYRNHLREAVERASGAPADEIARAEATMTETLREKVRDERLVAPFLVIGVEMFMIILCAFFSLAIILVFGVNPVLHIFAIAVVTRDGRVAGRMRLLWRWLMSWSIVSLVAIIGALSGLAVGSEVMFDDNLAELRVASLIVAGITGAALLAFSVHAALHPSRGIQDAICGTRLVPR